MITVTVYIREQCQECDQALADLKMLQDTLPHQVILINVDQSQAMRDKFGQGVPVVEIGPYRLQPPFTRQDLQIMLSAARDRVGQLTQVDQDTYQRRLEKGHSMSTSDKITRFLGHHYLGLAILFLAFYVGLPFLAPVLEKAGLPAPAAVIYKIYSAMCHQFAFRSFFLFGEQAVYPRALAGLPNLITYEALTNSTQIDIVQARQFIGNETLGYKVALCERDVAIYLSLLLFGIIFWASGRRLRSIPWYAWILIGLGPIGLDGVSQIPGLATGLPGWLPVRESTPFLRVLTGALFGLTTGWYLFPMLEDTARDTRRIFQHKLAVIEQTRFPEQ